MFRDITWEAILIRTVLSLIIGGSLGLERERKNRPAGFRTYMLVCLGSTIVMMTGQYVYQTYGVSDPVRLGAQVVSGIGFLGAGTIMVTGRRQVKGVTTAASLWAAACLGLALGTGFYEGAVIGAIVILLVMTIMERVDRRVKEKVGGAEIYIELDGKKPLSAFILYARENQLQIDDIHIMKNKFADSGEICATMYAESEIKRSTSEVIHILQAYEYTLFLETI